MAQAARTALRDAAGIRVPERSFIIWVVVGYLCVLVPANWLVFRFLGRVEWAWIAAPLIAIACTVVVIQQAQLNIGFARSRNEIAVVEMQAGLFAGPRGPLYGALYVAGHALRIPPRRSRRTDPAVSPRLRSGGIQIGCRMADPRRVGLPAGRRYAIDRVQRGVERRRFHA